MHQVISRSNEVIPRPHRALTREYGDRTYRIHCGNFQQHASQNIDAQWHMRHRYNAPLYLMPCNGMLNLFMQLV